MNFKERYMFENKFDFYSPINLKSYNLDQIIRYQLDVLGKLDPFTKRHSENVANLCCRLCEYLRCKNHLLFTVQSADIYMMLVKCLYHLKF